MKNKPSDDEIWGIIGFIKVSPSRLKTLQCLNDNHLMPTEISKITELSTAQVSIALHDLKKIGIVRCMNENAKKGRIYQCTPLGLEILDIIEKTIFNA